MEDFDTLLSIPEVSKRTNIPVSTIRHWIKSEISQLKYIKKSKGRIFIKWGDFLEFKKNNPHLKAFKNSAYTTREANELAALILEIKIEHENIMKNLKYSLSIMQHKLEIQMMETERRIDFKRKMIESVMGMQDLLEVQRMDESDTEDAQSIMKNQIIEAKRLIVDDQKIFNSIHEDLVASNNS